MKTTIEFVQNNWGIIVPVIIAITSEVMALHPNCKANGIIQLIINLLSKKPA